MTEDASYRDPRLAALYDRMNPFAADTEFYLAFADEHPGSRILDIGCGTGLLTVELARRGHRMLGADPAEAMLDIARTRDGGDLVEWLRAEASELPPGDADLAIMTGHVAQVFVTDEAWTDALAAAHRALRPGGLLVFESRDPHAQAWLRWGDGREALDTPDGPVTAWNEVTEASGGVVGLVGHYEWEDGEHVTDEGALRFRTEEELRASLVGAGFGVRAVYGDWMRGPVTDATTELIVVADARPV